MPPDNPDDRRPLHDFDHAPDVRPEDVDRCGECGRYAPHAFDHAPDCSRFDPIDDDPDVVGTGTVTPSAADNPRMVRPHADGGVPACRNCGAPVYRPDTTTKCDVCGELDSGGIATNPATSPPQSKERIAAELVAARPGDTVHVWVDKGVGSRRMWGGVVVDTGRRDRSGHRTSGDVDTLPAVERVVSFDSFGDPEARCVTRFTRMKGSGRVFVGGDPIMFDPTEGTYTIDRVEVGGDE